MASALELNATNTIINGQGLGTSSALVANIAAFQALGTVQSISTIFSVVSAANSTIQSNLYPVLNTLGTGAQYGQWLLDFYPTGTSAVSSNSVVLYGNTSTTASLSKTVLSQANYPFTNGVAGFANAYTTCHGYAISGLDTVASTNILQNKTYAQSGLGFSGPLDLATNGIGSNGALLASIIVNWGTMYDITNIATFADPYVFGQNLINQGLGSYGNLITQFTSVGLDVSNLTAAPGAVSKTQNSSSSTNISTLVGDIQLPSLTSVTTSTSSAGSSVAVMSSIYQSVTGANLNAIVNATQIVVQNSSITSLNDFLDITKVVPENLRYQLANLGITDFQSFGTFLQKLIGKGNFGSWSQLASFFNSIVVPNFSTAQTVNPNATVISTTVASNLRSGFASGSGPLGHALMIDFLGATAGIPYTANIQTLIASYSNISSSVASALTTLKTTVNSYIATFTTTSYSTSAVSTAVQAVNSALAQLGNTQIVWNAQQSYTNMINRLQIETSNFTKANAGILSVSATGLNNFAQGITTTATDSTLVNTKQIFDKIITADSYGDTLKVAIAEKLNSQILLSVGITTNNDPKPTQALIVSQQQNVPLTTYITQNQ
jgi:hypothetical protein